MRKTLTLTQRYFASQETAQVPTITLKKTRQGDLYEIQVAGSRQEALL